MVGNRNHAKIADVIDSGNLFDQPTQVKLLRKAAEIPSTAIGSTGDGMKIEVKLFPDRALDIAGIPGVIDDDFHIHIYANIFWPSEDDLDSGQASGIQESAHTV